jgi:hypothetical protein
MQGLEAPELDLRVLADREPRQAELEAVGALLDVIQEGGHLLLSHAPLGKTAVVLGSTSEWILDERLIYTY